MARPQIITERGYDLAEVVSALQKSIRRGIEFDALYWAHEMHRSGFGEYAWKRIKMIAAEDVGIGFNPGQFADLAALYGFWVELRKKDKRPWMGSVYLANAVIMCVRSQKCRLADDATYYHNSNHAERIDIPDIALDGHTRRGRAMGRAEEYFVTVSGVVENKLEGIDNPYIEWNNNIWGTKLDLPDNGPVRRMALAPAEFDKIEAAMEADDSDEPAMKNMFD